MSHKGRFRRIEKPFIAERFDYAESVRKRLDACGTAVGDTLLYAAAVQAFENLIPKTHKDDEYREDLEKAIIRRKEDVYTYWCGKKQGTPENPVLHNDPKDLWNYDPNEESPPKSPIEMEVEEPDWNARFYAAFNLFVRLDVIVRKPVSFG